MAKNKFRITENDFLLANRKASREEEIAKYGRQILLRTSVHKSKKVYDRKRLKKAGIKITDDLPFFRIQLNQFRRFSGSLHVSAALWHMLLLILSQNHELMITMNEYLSSIKLKMRTQLLEETSYQVSQIAASDDAHGYWRYDIMDALAGSIHEGGPIVWMPGNSIEIVDRHLDFTCKLINEQLLIEDQVFSIIGKEAAICILRFILERIPALVEELNSYILSAESTVEKMNEQANASLSQIESELAPFNDFLQDIRVEYHTMMGEVMVQFTGSKASQLRTFYIRYGEGVISDMSELLEWVRICAHSE